MMCPIKLPPRCETRQVELAEKKIGMEIIAAQQRGELARQESGRPISVPNGNTYAATLDEVGLTRRQAHEFRQMAALSNEDIDEVMEDARVSA